MKHYDYFWIRVLPHVLRKKRVRLDTHYKGQTIGIDLLGWFKENNGYYTEIIKAISLQRKQYQPYRAMEMILKRHELLLKAKINPIYVFPGAPHCHTRLNIRTQNAIENLVEFKRRADEQQELDHLQRKKPMAHARLIGVTDYRLVEFIAKWMIQHGMTCFRAPYEVEWQLVEMERQGITQATNSPDPVCLALGSRRMQVHTTYGKDAPKCLQFEGEFDFLGREHYKYDLSPYRNHLQELFTMVGCKYLPSPVGRDSEYIVKERLPKYFESIRNNTQSKFWQKQNLDHEYISSFHRVVNLLRYCPVLRKTSPDSDTLELVPLNPLPEGTKIPWKDWLLFDPVAELPVAPENYTKAAYFQGYSFGKPTESDSWCRNIKPIFFKNKSLLPPTPPPPVPPIPTGSSSSTVPPTTPAPTSSSSLESQESVLPQPQHSVLEAPTLETQQFGPEALLQTLSTPPDAPSQHILPMQDSVPDAPSPTALQTPSTNPP